MSNETETRQSTERLFARGFTILGGIFWIAAAFAGGLRIAGARPLLDAVGLAIWPLLFTVAVLAIGWFYERLVSLLLAIGAVGTIAWGVIMGWASGEWAIMLIFFIAPTVVAALLFYLAGGKTERRSKSTAGTHALS